jgi:hypothetical protein
VKCRYEIVDMARRYEFRCRHTSVRLPISPDGLNDPSGSEQVVLVGVRGGGGPVGDTQFGVDVFHMPGDGVRADHQARSDLPISPAGGQVRSTSRSRSDRVVGPPVRPCRRPLTRAKSGPAPSVVKVSAAQPNSISAPALSPSSAHANPTSTAVRAASYGMCSYCSDPAWAIRASARANHPLAGAVWPRNSKTKSQPKCVACRLRRVTGGTGRALCGFPVQDAVIVRTEQIRPDRHSFALCRVVRQRHRTSVRYPSSAGRASRRTRSRPPWRRCC